MMGEFLAQETHFCRQAVAYFSQELSAGKTRKCIFHKVDIEGQFQHCSIDDTAKQMLRSS